MSDYDILQKPLAIISMLYFNVRYYTRTKSSSFRTFFFLTAGSSKQAQLPSGPPRPNLSKEGWSSGVSTPQSQG